MSSLPNRIVVLVAVVVAGAWTHVSGQAEKAGAKIQLTARERVAVIQRAAVWSPTTVEAMDLRAGPKELGALAPFASVRCNYIEKNVSGKSPKFTCELAKGDQVKIKYGADNGEVYGVVAASRLLWALGFGADRWYPVSVTCHGCPADPMKGGRQSAGDATYEIAALERKMPGATVETRPEEGWDWQALDLVDEKAGGAPLAHRDALRLLAAMIQHTDNKPEQQRLVCGSGDGKSCAAPMMFIHDVGLTFGRATMVNKNDVSGVNLTEWAKASVWRDEKRCVTALKQSWTGSLGDTVIHEPGRKFLADLLVRLSDDQLRDLFEVSRFPQRSGTPIGHWIAVFSGKRDAIVRATCPS